MPKSLDDALWADQQQEEHQFHTTNTGISGRGIAIYHGSGDDSQDRRKTDIVRHLRKVDTALAPVVVSIAAWLVEGASGLPFEVLVIAFIILANGILGLLARGQSRAGSRRPATDGIRRGDGCAR